MKTLLKKFRASTALDRGDKPRLQCGTAEARRFEESLRAMDRDLRKPRPAGGMPPALHSSIMRAVQKSRLENEPGFAVLGLRRLAVPTLAVLIGVGVFWSVSRPSVKVVGPNEEAPSLAAVIAQGHELTQAAPDTVFEPLSGEMELLHRDLQNAVTFLADSLP